MDNGNNEKALALLDEVRYIDAWRDEQEIKAFASRLRETVPALANLKKPENVISAAQYASLTGANIFRGEMYAYEDWQGNLQIVDGYKLLVRWARRQCNFYDKYVPFTDEEKSAAGLSDKAFAYTCYVLRDDALKALKQLTDTGVPNAYEIVAQSAVGIVDEKDFVVQGGSNRGKFIPPPKGWTWDQVARKRALKNTLNLAYGMPSVQEIARESLIVGDIETELEDWQDVTGGPPEIREKEAALAAITRESEERMSEMTQEEKENWLKEQAFLRGDPDWDPVYSKEEQVVNGESRVVPDQTMLDTLEKLNTILDELKDGPIENGKHRFQVQRLYEMLGLGAPKWEKTTVESVRETIKTKIALEADEEEPEEKPEEEPAEEPEEEPVEKQEEQSGEENGE
jgi:hypothetical protein